MGGSRSDGESLGDTETPFAATRCAYFHFHSSTAQTRPPRVERGRRRLIFVDEFHAALGTIAGTVLNDFRVHWATVFVDMRTTMCVCIRVFAADEEGWRGYQREQRKRCHD
jgi:hypothetical protein